MVLLWKRSVAGVGESVAFFILGIATAVWAINQSRSSTAALGYLGLPLLGAVAGFLGLAFGRWRKSSEITLRLLSWVAFAGVVAVIISELYSGRQTVAKNAVRDTQYAVQAARIARNRDSINAALKANPGRQRLWIDSAIRARMSDRAFLIAALANDSVSPDVLDSLANSPDMGIKLEAVRNPNATGETLARVYRTGPYPYYYFQALAAHAHTPPEILRAIYTKPEPMGGLDIWFASNPATPGDVLDKIITRTRDPNVIRSMLQNPAVDCAKVDKLSTTMSRIYGDSVQASSLGQELEQRRASACSSQ